MSYEEIVSKIEKEKGLTAEEIDTKVEDKLKQLSGLVSKEGAAHIIANELGVRIIDSDAPNKIKIKNISIGMRNIEVIGKVSAIYDVRDFQTEKRSGRVGSFMLKDETGTARIVCWGDITIKIRQMNVGEIVRIKQGYAKENNSQKEIHLNDRSLIAINPTDESVDVEINNSTSRKMILDLKEGDENIDILGTVVSVFEPNFFEVCPECKRRARLSENNYVCQTHGNVTPQFSYVMNILLDDGTESIRSVLFRENVDSILSMQSSEIINFRESPNLFEKEKEKILGSTIKLNGRVVKNSFFDRIEFVVNKVNLTPDLNEEIKVFEEELAKVE